MEARLDLALRPAYLNKTSSLSSFSWRSSLPEAWQRRSAVVTRVLPSLYVEEFSTRDFERALQPLWGEAALSSP